MVKCGNKAVAKWLVQWSDLDQSYATWELASILQTKFPSLILEDKGVSPLVVVVVVGGDNANFV